MKQVITFGEVMLRLSAPAFARLTQAQQFTAVYAGSEANVSVSLAAMGIPAQHVTRFPENDLGHAAVQQLRKHSVDVSHVTFGDERMGLFFFENGAMHRASRIVYDRFDSAFSHYKKGDVPWDDIMRQASWFHWTGITPAISQGAADVCLEALEAAERHKVTVSGDINYRRNLWQYGKTARDIMPALVEKTNIMIAGTADMENCLGITDDDFETACRKVLQAYPRLQKIASTLRDSVSASHNRLTGILYNKENLLRSKTYDLTHIVDRVGGGDAYMAGLIYGWLTGKADDAALEFATAASALKHSIEGDVNIVSSDEVEALVKGENVGKLLR